jgi:hypothetical protein
LTLPFLNPLFFRLSLLSISPFIIIR